MAEEPRRVTFTGPFSMEGAFSTPSVDEWTDLATKSLRGRAIDRLTVEIDEGVAVKPLYTAADHAEMPGSPGRPPFTRGSLIPAERPQGWYSCPLYDRPDPTGDSWRPAAEPDSDVTAAWIRLGQLAHDRPAKTADRTSTNACSATWTSAEMQQLVSAIGSRPIILDGGEHGVALAALFTAATRALGADLGVVEGCFAIDPFASLVERGELTTGTERAFALMTEVASWCLRTAPGMRAATVSTIPYHMAGATTVQEMAFALASGVEYLRAFEGAGIEPALACGQLQFRCAVGRDLFTEVARMRAFRRLWATVAAECGVTDNSAAVSIHAVTSPRSLTARDPWVNMLRATVGTFAAAIGGADYITTLPFDAALGPAGDLGRRMAINTHRVLREESHLGRVLDPAGGSWYVEKLTDELAHAAWHSFQDIERRGGMRRALADGVIASAVGNSARAGRRSVATRKTPITGVSTWPNLGEEALPRAASAPACEPTRGESCRTDHPSLAALARLCRVADGGVSNGAVFEAAVAAADAGATLAQLVEALAVDCRPSTLKPLTSAREAEPFERLRDASDASLASTGQRPRAFLANLGSVADYTARSTFAKNLLEAGGIETVDSSGFESAEPAGAAFAASGCTAVCLCSSDERYETFAEDLVPALRANGAQVVLLAGKPAAGANGIDHFIHQGCDVLQVLGAVLSALEVTP